jgi:hypothetical protein
MITRLLQNQNFTILLSLFNCAILLNYNMIIWQNPIAITSLLITIITLFNTKIWQLYIINICLSSLVLSFSFPRMANHCNMELVIELVILALIGFKICVPKFKFSNQFIQYAFRISLITIYFFTGFHKLNTDFFNPCVSCVNGINERLINNFTGLNFKLPFQLSYSLQCLTIFIEMILPFGLLWHKSRKWTAIGLLFFHFCLSFVCYADFSGLATFLIIGAILNFEENIVNQKLLSGIKVYIFFTIIAVIINAICLKSGFTLYQRYFYQGLFFNLGWLIFIWIFFKYHTEKQNYFNKKHFPLLFSIVLIISLWSMKTYIGLGNSGNLTMFSNLLTEKTRSNHLIINTAKTKIFDFEEDAVLVLKLEDPIKKDSLVGFKIPLIEFKYLTHQLAVKYPKTEVACTLVYKNDTLNISDLKKSKFNDSKWWWYRFVNFRKIQPQGANKCYW